MAKAHFKQITLLVLLPVMKWVIIKLKKKKNITGNVGC